MADSADLADVQNEAAHTADLLRRKPAGPRATGHCLFCFNSLPSGLRWCDKGCQEDWEREQEAAKRNGG